MQVVSCLHVKRHIYAMQLHVIKAEDATQPVPIKVLLLLKLHRATCIISKAQLYSLESIFIYELQMDSLDKIRETE